MCMPVYFPHLHFLNQQILRLSWPINELFTQLQTVSYVSLVTTVNPLGNLVEIVAGFSKSLAGFNFGILHTSDQEKRRYPGSSTDRLSLGIFDTEKNRLAAFLPI